MTGLGRLAVALVLTALPSNAQADFFFREKLRMSSESAAAPPVLPACVVTPGRLSDGQWTRYVVVSGEDQALSTCRTLISEGSGATKCLFAPSNGGLIVAGVRPGTEFAAHPSQQMISCS